MQTQLSPRIVADSTVLSGKPVIEGTTVPVSTLIEAVAAGNSFADVACEYHVSEDDVRAALTYGAKRADEAIVIGDPLFAVAGIFESDDPDWVNRHDELLAEAYGDDHADEQ